MKWPRNTPLFITEDEMVSILGLSKERASELAADIEPCGGITDKNKVFRELYPTSDIRKAVKND